MKQCKVYPGYTDFYTHYWGECTILLERTRHSQGGEVVYRHVMTFDSPAEAKHHFDTQCGV